MRDGMAKTSTPPEPVTEADIERALAALDAERATVAARLASFQQREHDLIAADAPDAELDALDEERRRDERQIERLDLRERALIERAGAIRAEAQRATLASVSERWGPAVERMQAAWVAAADARAELVRLKQELEQAGLNRAATSFTPPLPAPLLTRDNAETTCAAIAHAAKYAHGIEEAAPTFRVTFLKAATLKSGLAGFTLYRVGETATLPASVALDAIRRGVASWTIPQLGDVGAAGHQPATRRPWTPWRRATA